MKQRFIIKLIFFDHTIEKKTVLPINCQSICDLNAVRKLKMIRNGQNDCFLELPTRLSQP